MMSVDGKRCFAVTFLKLLWSASLMVLITVRLRMMSVDDVITKPVHRLEVFTGAGRRRMWSDEDKAQIVNEIVASGESLSAVARRHGLSPQQLFGWRRQLQATRSELLGKRCSAVTFLKMF